MLSESLLPPEIIRAYGETEYRVDLHPPLVLHIAEHSAALVRLYRFTKSASCAFITACNPYSRRLSDTANAARHADLMHELERRELKFLQGEGKHPTGDWPGEPSFLVMGLSREEAMTIGRTYEQNAIVWCGPDAVPQLVLLR